MDNIQIKEELYNSKLDRVLCAELPNLSRNQVLRMIKNSGVMVNGKIELNRNVILKRGDFFSYDLGLLENPSDEIKPENLPLDILYEDDDIVVINKSVGLVVHPGAGNWTGTVLNGILYHDSSSNPIAINRLDKDTSGVMFIAKNSESRKYYSQLFESRRVYKRYLCVVPRSLYSVTVKNAHMDYKIAEIPLNEKFINIHGFIDRHPIDRKKMFFYNYEVSDDYDKPEFMMRVKKDPTLKKSSRYAECEIKVVHKGAKYLGVEVILKTGRKHQIRAAFKALNCPILGDTIYGGDENERLMLHSFQTKIVMKDGKLKEFVAQIPKEFKKYFLGVVE